MENYQCEVCEYVFPSDSEPKQCPECKSDEGFTPWEQTIDYQEYCHQRWEASDY